MTIGQQDLDACERLMAHDREVLEALENSLRSSKSLRRIEVLEQSIREQRARVSCAQDLCKALGIGFTRLPPLAFRNHGESPIPGFSEPSHPED